MLLALLVDYDLLVLGTKEFGTAARPQSEPRKDSRTRVSGGVTLKIIRDDCSIMSMWHLFQH